MRGREIQNEKCKMKKIHDPLQVKIEILKCKIKIHMIKGTR